MQRAYVIILFFFICSNVLGQACPSLTSPINGANNVPVDAQIVWEQVSGVTGYIISIGTVPGGNDILRDQTSTNFYSPPFGLPDDTLIYVTITLFFFNLPNIECPSESFRTVDITTPPGCTTISNPINGETNVNVASNINWNYVIGADGYIITIGTASNAADIVNNLDVGSVLHYNLSIDFTPLTEIFVKVVPYNDNGSLSSCIEESFVTGDIAELPNCSNVIFPSNGETNVILSPLIEWEAVSGANGYKVYIGSSPLENDVLDGASFFTNSTFVINFEPNTLYFIRVVPFNDSGDAIGCQQGSFSTILGCGPFFDIMSGELITLNPIINFPDQVGICLDQTFTTITSDNIADGYRWYSINTDGTETLISDTRNANIADVGLYRLELFNFSVDSGNGIECRSSKEFTAVVSESPNIVGVNVNQISNTIEITVQVDGIGDYEYALSDPSGPYQNSNFFSGAPIDTTRIFVRDKNGCGFSEFEIINVTGFPKYFTPNADGINDFWQYRSRDGDSFTLISIEIFDRFGRLLKQIGPNSIGWNGTIDGIPLPTTDYWFKASTSNGARFIGHFSLKR